MSLQRAYAVDEKINWGKHDHRNGANRHYCPRARYIPKSKQRPECRPEQSCGGKQEVAADAITTASRERFSAKHEQSGNDNRAADDALEGRLFVEHQRGQD